ncbi:MAG: indolepyruvate ferredoxin oxidoreductase family protein, partial [Thiolinea sp.]
MTAKLTPQQILDQKYTLSHGQTLMSGSQALVRLPMLQKESDRRAGLNTGGFISGYRGSPLSGFDQQLWRAEKYLQEHDVVFQPGVNEDLAATAVWGTQQVNLSDQAQFDGVFSMWYGKGPGVDRSIDPIKHANMAGTSKYGGVLMVAGDDHAAKSSTTAHQSDHVMAAAGVPVLYPSNVQEFIDFGLHGWAMSRYSGLWVGLKCVTQVVETTSTVEIDPERQRILLPDDFEMPEGGLNLRWPDPPLVQEQRLVNDKWYAALAYIRANRLNRVVIDAPQARFGIMAAGKAYQDVRQALDDLGLGRIELEQLGVRVMKVGCVWPLDAQNARQFAEGLDEILVVEEKRQILEYALKEELYNWRDDVRPKVYGKFDARGDAGGEWASPRADWLLPSAYELSSSLVAKAIAKRLITMELPADIRRHIEQRIAVIEQKEREAAKPKVTNERTPWFCSGCPHNSSTKVPEGSRALAGIGCHYMVQWMDRDTATFSHMGGEGAAWIGQSPFLSEQHVFVNMGDGTYFHSGLLAIRAAVGSKVNITYKILFNDAIAMTGGQPVDGQLTVSQLAHQVVAEGVMRTVIVTDNLAQYTTALLAELPVGVDVFHRDELDEIQKSLRETTGTTVLIYEQMCATEKRRRRKRGTLPTVDKHVFIHDAVCEGCGDCSKASNCLSVEPLETAFGTKRKINHSTCNQDFSCVKGFCPSFVTVEGAELRVVESKTDPVSPLENGEQGGFQSTDLPEPDVPELNTPCRILITGVGGTGVITVGALIGMAAYLDDLASSALDMTGLAQKGGAVLSHVQLANEQSQLYSSRIALAEADVLLGCDGIVSASTDALSRTLAGRTKAVVNSNETPTAAFVLNRDWTFPGTSVVQDVRNALGEDGEFIDANELALQLLGSTLYANALIIGYAWQKGWLPLKGESLLRAMEINGVKVTENQQAFQWGRYFAHHGAGSDAGGRIQPKVAEST